MRREGMQSYPRSLSISVLLLCLLKLMVAPAAAMTQDALWQALGGSGHVALLRHAIAPGTGDPSNFTIDDCSTQRNLSEEGRSQAIRIGARFKANGIVTADVFSSQWCRCLDTARRLGLGEVKPLPILNSFYGRHERRDERTDSLSAWLNEANLDEPVIMVTHQVNISALTGIYPSSGELVIVRVDRGGTISVAGTIETD
ncbi:MAG: histidine phosphatase family protein [Geminicoccaceae bacterium]